MLIIASYPDKEVDHKEDVESEIDLLSRTVGPSFARFNCLAASTQQL